MKLWKLCLFILAMVSCAGAQESNPSVITPEDVRDIPTIGAIELRNRLGEFSNKIVRLRFNGRYNVPAKPEGERLVASLAEYDFKKITHYTEVKLETSLPKEAETWYLKLSSRYGEKTFTTVFVRVLGAVPDAGVEGGKTIRVWALGTDLHAVGRTPEFMWPHDAGDSLDAPLKAELAKEIPTLSAVVVKAKGRELVGRVVRLQFTYPIDDLKDGVGNLYDQVPKNGHLDSGFVSAIVPPEGVEWYKKLTRSRRSGAREPVRQTAYVLVLGEADNLTLQEQGLKYGIRVKVLGRDMRPGFKGPEYIW